MEVHLVTSNHPPVLSPTHLTGPMRINRSIEIVNWTLGRQAGYRYQNKYIHYNVLWGFIFISPTPTPSGNPMWRLAGSSLLLAFCSLSSGQRNEEEETYLSGLWNKSIISSLSLSQRCSSLKTTTTFIYETSFHHNGKKWFFLKIKRSSCITAIAPCLVFLSERCDRFSNNIRSSLKCQSKVMLVCGLKWIADPEMLLSICVDLYGIVVLVEDLSRFKPQANLCC